MDAGAWVSLLTCVGALGGLSFIVRPALRARDEDPMFRPEWLVLLAGGAEGRRPDDADDGDWRRWPTSPPRIPPRGGTSDEYGWRHTRRSIQKTRATQRHAERRQEALGQAGLRPKTSPVLKLHEGGVRAVRLDLYRGGPEGLKSLERWGLGVHELARWHVELYEDSKDLPDLEGRLAALPKVTIDHLGVIRDSYPALLRLIEKGEGQGAGLRACPARHSYSVTRNLCRGPWRTRFRHRPARHPRLQALRKGRRRPDL